MLEEEIRRLEGNLNSKSEELNEAEKARNSIRAENESNLNKIKMLQREVQEMTEKYEEKLLGIEHCVNNLTKENSELRKKKLEENRELNRKLVQYEN